MINGKKKLHSQLIKKITIDITFKIIIVKISKIYQVW